MKQKTALLLAALCLVAALSAASAGQKKTLGLGHGQAVVSVAHKSLEKMAQSVLEKSNGTIEIQVFPANQLGNERDLGESLSQGIVDMAWVSTAVMENFDAKLSMFSLPYVFKSYDHVADVVNSEIGGYVFGSLLASQRIRTLGFFDQGFRWVWNNAHPIHKLEDFKGLKIRAPESPVYMGTFKYLGTNPTPIPWGEVYTSMQTKVVQGFECTAESNVANKMYEVTKYGSRTNHIYAGSILMIAEDVWETLTPEEQKLVADEAKKAEADNRAQIIAMDEQLKRDMIAGGMELNDIEDKEIDRLADAVRPLYKDYAARLGSDDIIERAQKMYRK